MIAPSTVIQRIVAAVLAIAVAIGLAVWFATRPSEPVVIQKPVPVAVPVNSTQQALQAALQKQQAAEKEAGRLRQKLAASKKWVNHVAQERNRYRERAEEVPQVIIKEVPQPPKVVRRVARPKRICYPVAHYRRTRPYHHTWSHKRARCRVVTIHRRVVHHYYVWFPPPEEDSSSCPPDWQPDPPFYP